MASESRRRIACALLVGAAATSFAPIARADGASPAERETARQLMDAGLGRLKRGDAAGAVELLSKAHGIMHVPTTGLALARADIALGHLVEAREVALEVTRMPESPAQPAVFRSAIHSARDLASDLKPRIPTLRLSVRRGPPNRVTLDGSPLSTELVGVPVAVNPGHHVVAATNATGEETRVEVDAAEGESPSVTIELKESQTGATIAASAPVVVQEGSGTTKPPAPSRGPLRKVLIFGGFGLGAGGLAVGTLTGLFTLSLASKVTGTCTNSVCSPSSAGNLHTANVLATVSDVSFILGGVGVAAGVVGLTLTAESTPGVGAALWVGPQGVRAEGSF